MRKYIDQEAAQKIVCSTCEVCRNPTLETLMECEICSGFAKIPAEDVQPVVRGFWVEENGEDAHTGELWCIWKCSECGARRTAGWRYTQEGRKPRDNFCPNCGARMDLEG